METVLLDSNAWLRRVTGVDRFHAAGYFGSRVMAGTGEKVNTEVYSAGGRIIPVLGDGTSEHAVQTAAVFFQVAPEATLYSFSTNTSLAGGQKHWDFFSDCLPVIDEKRIANVFFSRVENDKTAREKHAAVLAARPWLKEFWAAGNDGAEGYSKLLQVEDAIGVGAAEVLRSSKVIGGPRVYPAGYTSQTELVDFAAPGNPGVNIRATSQSDSAQILAGTSFAAPWLCAMACLVDDFFLDRTGQALSRAAMVRFFKDHCQDIGKAGKDNQSGFGLVVLPEPEEIDIEKYVEVEQMTFTDQDKIAPWAKEAVEWCVEHGLMQGKGEAFDPLAPITRQEMAVILKRLGATSQSADADSSPQGEPFRGEEFVRTRCCQRDV